MADPRATDQVRPQAPTADPTTDDPTLSPSLRSWLPSAHEPGGDFPLQNIPLGAAIDDQDNPVLVTAVGDQVVNLDMLMHAGALGTDDLADAAHDAMHHGNANALMAVPEVWTQVRRRVQAWLQEGAPGGQQARRLREKAMTPLRETELVEPCHIGNYTDFYASIDHARTVGSMFRPDNPLLPNYKHVPIGYHGRASSVVVSGVPVKRPHGQTMPEGASTPVFGPTKRLDYELELGLLVGTPTGLGQTIPIDEVGKHIFGMVLVNDWSARDMQAWEYQPLGPFLAKNFATTISPWIVTREPLEPFRIAGPVRAGGEPVPLEYLRTSAAWALDINVRATISSAKMRAQGASPVVICEGNAKTLYWTIAQLLTHHASNGCPMETGDLLATGTISGPTPGSRGCLLERTWAGTGPDSKPLPRTPIELPTGEKRLFIEDGDEIVLSAWCESPGVPYRIGFGACRAVVEG
jgi:fumarylacetoacetase